MRKILSALILGFITLGGALNANAPCAEPTPEPQPVTLEEVDYQIKILKQSIDEYNNRAYRFDSKAQGLMSHDFTGYRHAEGMSERCKGIADDLNAHLQRLEKQREEMVKAQPQKQALKPTPSSK